MWGNFPLIAHAQKMEILLKFAAELKAVYGCAFGTNARHVYHAMRIKCTIFKSPNFVD